MPLAKERWPGGKRARDDAQGQRPVRRFAQAEQNPGQQQQRECRHQGGRRPGERPRRDRHGIGGDRAQAIQPRADKKLRDAVGEKEAEEKLAQVSVREMHLRGDLRRGHGDRLAIEIVDQRGQEQQGRTRSIYGRAFSFAMGSTRRSWLRFGWDAGACLQARPHVRGWRSLRIACKQAPTKGDTVGGHGWFDQMLRRSLRVRRAAADGPGCRAPCGRSLRP